MSLARKTLVVTGTTALVLVLLMLLLAGALSVGLANMVAEWGGPATVYIDGETFTFSELGFSHALAVSAALLLAGLVVAVVVPMALGFAALAVVVALVVAVGAPVIALALVAGLLFSPLLLIGTLVWLLLRRRKAPAAGSATATMAA